MQKVNDSFVEDVKKEFDEILKKYGFELNEIRRDGSFDNCEMIYRTEHEVISINRSRGWLMIYYGINYMGKDYAWPLDALVKYLFKKRGENTDDYRQIFAVSDEWHSFALEYKRYKLMLESYLKDVIDYINSDDFNGFKKNMDAFDKILSDIYIDELKWRKKGDQQK